MTRTTAKPNGLLEAAALLPWWVGLALAVVSYVALHALAAQTMSAPMQTSSAGALRAMLTGVAYVGQYIAPIIFIVGAGMSFLGRRKRKALVADVAQSRIGSALDGMSWREFEMLVGESFRLKGYRVQETGGGGADGGVDLVLSRGTETFVVQCKQWKAMRVGVDVVRELYGVMSAKGAAAGFVVTSGRFTQDAKEFAQGRNVKLIDGPELHGLIVAARKSLGHQTEVSREAASPGSDSLSPACPRCGSGMVKRTAKSGSKAGQQFWGCSTYPRCMGTREIG